MTANVSTTTNISGQQVYLGSGSNFVTLSGAVVSISGNAVQFASGSQLNLSGLFVTISGGVSTSGSAVTISGQAIAAISGAVSIMSGTVSVSGLTQAGLSFESGIGGISGAVPTVLMAFDLSGAKWNPLSVTNSGSNTLSVLTTGGGSPNISGGVVVSGGVTVSGSVSITSGEIHVASGSVTIGSGANLVMSGLAVASGLWLASGIQVVAQSGIAVSNSGAYINIASGSVGGFSGLNVTVGSGALAIVSGDIAVLCGLITLGSGGNLVGSVSIASGIINVGNPTMTSGFGFSGGLGVVNSMYDFSGQAWVPLSSVTSGSNSSLEVAQAPATQIRIGLSGTAAQSGIPNTSGGTALQSGDLYVITVRNVSGNNDMYVGGSGARPFSGFGFVLCGGDAVTMSITNANLVYVFATTSGQFVKWIGSQF